MSDYQHHIFLSYRRTDKHWIRWANIVADALAALLAPKIGAARIFRDTTIETGAPWPQRLAEAHARSQILVPLLSRDYFTSDWCRCELTLMYKRQKHHNLKSTASPAILIIPFVIDDGKCFPSEIQEMQLMDISDYANPFLQTKSRTHFRFTQILKKECDRIELALKSTPPFEAAWEKLANEEFQKLFEIQTESQHTLPGLSLLTAERSSDNK